MHLSGATTVHDLLLACPELREYTERVLPRRHRSARSRAAAKWRRTATLADVARELNLTHIELLRGLRAEAVRLGVADRFTGAGDPAPSLDEAVDLASLVRLLEEGRDLREVSALVGRAKGDDSVRGETATGRDAGPCPGAARESGPSLGDLRDPCDDGEDVEPGHPLHTLRREIAAAEQLLSMLSSALEAMEREPAEWIRVRPLVFRLLDLLSGLERHHRRAIDLVCPRLRGHGRGELGRLLYEAADEVERLLAEVRRGAESGEAEAVTLACRRLLEAAAQSLRQEEYLLLPLAAATLGEDEWRAVRAAEAAIGWALVDTPPPWPARP